MAGFHRRAGRFMTSFLDALNATTFTPLSAITDPIVSNEDISDVDRTTKILADMQFIEVNTDANGVKSYRLTPSGVVRAQVKFQEVK